jgi:leucyl-tRNA synthetase
MDEDALNKLISADEKITKYLENKDIKKKIYIKDKLINIII